MLIIPTPPTTERNLEFLPALHPWNQQSCLQENSVTQHDCETWRNPVRSACACYNCACGYYTANVKRFLVVGQLRPQKWYYCAVSVKSVRFGRECKQSKSNIFLICHILWHFQDGRHWPWEFHMGQKLKHAQISLKIVSNCLSCHKDSNKV